MPHTFLRLCHTKTTHAWQDFSRQTIASKRCSHVSQRRRNHPMSIAHNVYYVKCALAWFLAPVLAGIQIPWQKPSPGNMEASPHVLLQPQLHPDLALMFDPGPVGADEHPRGVEFTAAQQCALDCIGTGAGQRLQVAG